MNLDLEVQVKIFDTCRTVALYFYKEPTSAHYIPYKLRL